MPAPPKIIHIYTKKNTQTIRHKVEELSLLFSKRGLSYRVVTGEEHPAECPDIVFVLGGDGTFLSANYLYSPSAVPLFGVDLGGLGFLSEASLEGLDGVTEQVLAGEYFLEERMLADCCIIRKDGSQRSDFALNDVVLYRGPLAHMIRLTTTIDGEYLASFPADGMIVATPTGSTAYSLSAGGPVIYPVMELFIINPICAHTLYARSIIAPPNCIIEIILESAKEGTMVTIDGVRGCQMNKGDRIVVKKSSFSARMVRLKRGKPFYSLLRSKLSWGMDIRKKVE